MRVKFRKYVDLNPKGEKWLENSSNNSYVCGNKIWLLKECLKKEDKW